MSRGARIRRRTWVGGVLALAVVLVLFLAARPYGALLTTALGALLALLGVREAWRMGTLPDGRAAAGAAAAVVCTALAVGGGALDTRLGLDALRESTRYWITLGGALGVAFLVGLVAALPAGERLGSRAVRTLWLAAPLPLLGLVRRDLGVEGLAVLVGIAKVGDVAAYYGGQLLGGTFPTHPFPRLSPGKTTVGCVCSLVAATVAGGVCVALGWLPRGDLGIVAGLVAGAVVNVAAQAGDLLESAAKREAGVKDSGSWFGPSGGVLDLVDSLLLAVPAALLVWPALW